MTIQNRVKTKCRQKCLNGPKLNQIFLIRFKLVTKLDFSNTTLKPSGRVRENFKTEESSHEETNNQNNVFLFFSESLGVVHKEFVPPGITVNQRYYLEVLDCLRKKMMRIRMEITDHWIPGPSSWQCARAHSIVSLWTSGEKVHSRASAGSLFSRFVTLWFSLVPKLKSRVKGNHFQTLDSVQKAVSDVIKTPKRLWPPILLWGAKIRFASEGYYSEGDIVNSDK
jgi:hypothetical protein